MQTTWNIFPRTHEDLVTQLLVNRGVAESDREVFLTPDWDRDTHSPYAFSRMKDAVAVVFRALASGKRMVIHGDYDADGVSGSALLFRAFSEIAERLHYPCSVDVFLPDRERDGYGVAMHTVKRFIDEGVEVLVTVDCGIANGLELDAASEAGLDVVVCDHHQLGEHLPSSALLLHPLAPGETYPNTTLCGTGVAFKFASACFDEARARGADFPRGYERWFLDFVAIATVTDVMPLLGENRALEHFGLSVLNKTRRPGLRALVASSRSELGALDTTAIGFRIGPRLNAAGRLASARLAFDTVVASTDEEAMVAAARLEQLNTERQSIFRRAYTEAKQQAQLYADHAVLVLESTTWLPGIIGLIAGRLVSDFGRPAFVLTQAGSHFVGSGRTAGGLHLVEAMNACGDIFVKKGGHPQACGLTIATLENVVRFRERINAHALGVFGQDGVKTVWDIDAVCAPSQLTLSVVEEIGRLAPFGQGNREPRFVAEGVTIMAVETMGSAGRHVRVTALDDAGNVVKFVGFSMEHLVDEFAMGMRVDIAYSPNVNIWNGKRSVAYYILDYRV